MFFIPPSAQAQVTPPAPTPFPVDSTRFPVDSTRFPQVPQDTAEARRRGLLQQGLRNPADSLGLRRDSLGLESDTLAVDTTWVVYLDSTYRLAQFKHYRTDDPTVAMFPNPSYPLYLNITSPGYTRELQLDTLGQTVTIREMVNGVDVKVPTTLPLEEYIRQRYEYEKANNWRMLATQYTMKQQRDELGGLLGNFTNITIPVPANPLLSIFGKPGIHVNVSGGVDIRGAFRNTSSDQSTISQLDQSRNEPDFNQDVQVNVSGTVGDKLNIMADWNTQRTFEYENQLKIKYTGYDDEIVQSVEAGNVSLQTPSLVGGGQALFGIKARMQAGPLMLTTLLSQKKGQSKELTVSGGATSQDFQFQPHQYSRNHFFLDTTYIDFYEPLHATQIPTLSQQVLENQVIQLDVYLSMNVGALVNQSRVYGKAYLNLPTHGLNQNYTADQIASLKDQEGQDGMYKDGFFLRLDPTKDYKYDQYGGTITLMTSYSDDQTIAVAYTIVGPANVNRVYGGTEAGNDTLMYLKLIKPQNLTSNPSYRTAWKLMMKNIYPIGSRNIKKEGFKLDIWRRNDGATDVTNLGPTSVPIIQIVGLDRFDDNNAPNPNTVFDFLPGYTIDVDQGEIIFPTLRPFDSTIAQYFRTHETPYTDSLLFSEVYDTTTQGAQNSTKNKYYFKGTAAGTQTSRYNLGMNLVEGSVQVLLNGTALTPNVDYTVDYIVGEVVLRKPEALLPGANVQVKYEQNDLFQLASKTLIGARGELSLFPNTALGFTIMNLNQATLSDKVRLNEEPTNNMIMGTDFSTSFNAPILTDALDALPFLRTKEMSTVRFGGEAAYMIPDPNTLKSTVLSDNGASIAYIDDFEGALRTIPMAISYMSWTPASPPAYTLLGPGAQDSDKVYSKAELSWYNRLPTDVTTDQIWPNRNTRAGQNQVTVLNLDYNPNHRGMYNFSPNLDSTLHRANIGGNTGRYSSDAVRGNWNGVMRYIGTTAGSILEQNITYMEIWAKAEIYPGEEAIDADDLHKGRLFIDLGRISEDVIPNKVLNSEDIIKTSQNPAGIPNGVLNEGEDLGLDMLDNAQEQATYASFLASNAGDPDVDRADPSGDDYQPYGNGTDLRKFNGTENNKRDPSGLLPNTEDLNGNGSVDLSNQYLEYEVPLDTVYTDSVGVLRQNLLKVGGGGINKGWYQFRIPLLDPNRVIGTSSPQSILQNVQYIRLWISGFAKPIEVRIAEMDLVGNQWQQRSTLDTTLKVSTVNIEDNPNYQADWHEMGIQRAKDRTDPNQIIEANEQSLSLILNGLQKDSTRQIVKYFTVRPMDVFNYKHMKMFVHGDLGFSPGPAYDAEIFIRFGSDSLNFYEYREPIHRGWDVPENQIDILFSDLTTVKARRDTTPGIFRMSVPDHPGAFYGIQGNPSLRQIREISIGVTNIGTSAALYGSVWVNELRLVDVDNSPGMAYRFDSQIKLADVGSVAFNYSRQDPSFHALDQRFGNQVTGINWAVNTSFALDRFFPQDWQGTSIPIGYSHSEGLIKPKYLPNTDVVVDAAAARAQTPAAADSLITTSQTLSVRDAYSLSNFKIVPPTQAWYIRDTFSKLSLGFTYNTSRDRDPAVAERTNWSWNLRLSYGVSLPPDYYIQPFKDAFSGIFLLNDFKDWKLYFVPITSLSASAGGSRSRAYELARAPGSIPRETRNFGASKQFGFGWKLTEGGLTNLSGDYGLSLDRNLLRMDNDTVGRDWSTILKNLFFGGVDGRYGQRVSINSKPKIPNILNITKYFDLSAGYGVNYSWQNTFQQGDIGKSAGWDNSITLNTTLRLKSLTDPWFEESPEAVSAMPQGRRDMPPAPGEARRERPGADTSAARAQKPKVPDLPDSLRQGTPGKNLFGQLKSLAKVFIKVPFLDYENISINYNQTNRSGNAAVVGGTGIKNFWGRLPFQGSTLEYGPSRIYQLGLITDPSGTLKFSPHSSFPFIGFETTHGLRAANATFTDQFQQGNTVTLRTNRPLWEGASLELNWKVTWQFSKSTTVQTDSLGRPTFGEPTTAGSVERSFLSLPPFLLFKFLRSNLEDVGRKYNAMVPDTVAPDAPSRKAALAQSFENGMEALPFLNKVLGQFAPRPNWALRWDGLEKIGGLKSVVERMSLEHNYTSSFRRDYRGYPGRGDETDVERITYGFSPLAGINTTFRQFLKGSMSGSLRFNSTTSYDLNLASTPMNIVETFTQEITFSLNYGRHGFSFPLFGLSLSNDVDISLAYSRAKNSKKRYDPTMLEAGEEGVPLEGSTRTTLEPRIKYVLSTRVTAAIFFKYTSIAPDEGGSLIFGTTTNEAGIDIHISI